MVRRRPAADVLGCRAAAATYDGALGRADGINDETYGLFGTLIMRLIWVPGTGAPARPVSVRQHAVPGILYNSPAMLGDLRIDRLADVGAWSRSLGRAPGIRSLTIAQHQHGLIVGNCGPVNRDFGFMARQLQAHAWLLTFRRREPD